MAFNGGAVYMDAQMEGYLEKKGKYLGKNKYWSYLQGHILYMQNEKDNVVINLDISEAHLVRKVQSDASGSQFDVIFPKKKEERFICAKATDCNDWVKALQNAMMCTATSSSSTFYLEPGSQDSIYETIDGDEIAEPKKKEKPALPERNPLTKTLRDTYAQPRDGLPTPPLRDPPEAIYSEVQDVKDRQDRPTSDSERDSCAGAVKHNPFLAADKARKSGGSTFKPSPQSSQRSGVHGNNTGPLNPPGLVSFNGHSNDKQEHEPHGNQSTDTVMNNNAVSSPSSQRYSKDFPSKSKASYTATDGQETKPLKTCDTSSSSEDTNIEVESPVRMRSGSTFSQASAQVDDVDDADGEAEGDTLFETLAEALSEVEPVEDEFSHRLSRSDQTPVETLKAFLSNNRDVCRFSFVACGAQEDAVSNMKAYMDKMKTTELRDLFTHD